MNNIYIYNKETLNILAEPFIISLEDFKREPTKFFPTWNNQKMIISEVKLSYPIFIDGILREKTEKELKINKIIPLVPGEYIQDNQIIKVELSDNFLLPIWSIEKKKWEEGTNEEGLIKEQDRILQEYKEKLFTLGYSWNEHCQKARAKDIALLESVISSTKLSIEKGMMTQDTTINWYFNRNDKAKLKLEDFYNLKLAGIAFIQKIYDVEVSFKEEIRIDITFEKFLLKFSVNQS